jgi:site-specific DNA recombinase
VTPKGNQWRGAQVRQLLLAERNAGLREVPGERPGDPFTYSKGNWPAIVSEDVWRGVCAKLADPKRRQLGSRARKHLMSGLALCGKCHRPLTSGVTTGTKHRNYRCRFCRGVARDGEKVDAVVVEAVVDRLARPDAAELVIDRSREDLDELQVQAAALRAQIAAAETEYDEGIIDGRRLAARKERVNEKLRPIVASMEDANRAEVFEGVFGADDVDAAFDALDLGRKRAIITALVTVTVNPSRSGRVFHRGDVDVAWKP